MTLFIFLLAQLLGNRVVTCMKLSELYRRVLFSYFLFKLVTSDVGNKVAF